MNSDIENLYQEIGWDALDMAGDDLSGKLLIYASVEDGCYSSDVFMSTGREW